jgi:hypothetical protein
MTDDDPVTVTIAVTQDLQVAAAFTGNEFRAEDHPPGSGTASSR